MQAHSGKHQPMSLNLPLSGEASLGSFLPRVQHRLIAAGRTLANAPFEEHRSGAILLVDVSGFTELAERFINEGRLPNLKKLRDQGTFRPLRTTFPAISPVAWSTFQTGVNPGKHNIYDFLARKSANPNGI